LKQIEKNFLVKMPKNKEGGIQGRKRGTLKGEREKKLWVKKSRN